MFRDFFYQLPKNFVRCFTGRNTLWHVFAAALTYILVTSGFDWWYFEATRGSLLFSLAFPAAVLGFFVPVFGSLGVYFYGVVRRAPFIQKVGSALVQAGIMGLLISSLYKAFTGRLQPELVSHLTNADLSRNFNFGFLRNGVFWGWPSSHTTVAFAMTSVLLVFFPRRKAVIALALLYAFYIGFGVSMTIHWFSDFVAGALIGTVIGIVVAKSYQRRGA